MRREGRESGRAKRKNVRVHLPPPAELVGAAGFWHGLMGVAGIQKKLDSTCDQTHVTSKADLGEGPAGMVSCRVPCPLSLWWPKCQQQWPLLLLLFPLVPPSPSPLKVYLFCLYACFVCMYFYVCAWCPQRPEGVRFPATRVIGGFEPTGELGTDPWVSGRAVSVHNC